MSKRATGASEMEPGRSSERVMNVATQTGDGEATVQQDRGLARAQSFDHDAQLSQSKSYRETRMLQDQEAAVETGRRSRSAGAPAVRLDMDLDVHVKMQAKVKGRLELSVL